MSASSIILTTDDIEREFDEPKSTQAKRRMKGIGPPYVKRGNRILTFREDYIAWLNSLKRQSTSEEA